MYDPSTAGGPGATLVRGVAQDGRHRLLNLDLRSLGALDGQHLLVTPQGSLGNLTVGVLQGVGEIDPGVGRAEQRIGHLGQTLSKPQVGHGIRAG